MVGGLGRSGEMHAPDFCPDSKAEYEKRTDSQYSIREVSSSGSMPAEKVGECERV